MAAGVEVAGEVAEPVLELDAPAVCAPIIDEEDAEILERALEHTAASTPCRAGGRGARREGRRRRQSEDD